MLRDLLQSAFDGLDEKGWLKLSRNWAWFFLVLAVLNEVLRHFTTRITAASRPAHDQVWGVGALSFLFTFAQIPMLLRRRLGEKAAEDAETTTPHD
jgi:intracellular septation protein